MIWLTGAIAFFGLCTVIVGAFQWCAMRGQLDEMKAANLVTQRQLEASVGSFGVGLSGDRRTVSWHFQNDGKGIAALGVTWTAELEATRISDGNELQRETTKSSSPSNVLAGFPVTSEFALNDQISGDLGREVIRVTVNFHYDAGFGKISQGSFCRELVGDETINGSGRTLYIGDHDCSNTALFVERRRKQLRMNRQFDQQKPN
jgi:hypothetical protein